MSRWRLLAKYGAIGTLISLGMIVLSYVTTIWIIDQGALVFDRRSSRATALRESIEKVKPDERLLFLREISGQQFIKNFKSVYLLSEAGKILYPLNTDTYSQASPPDSPHSLNSEGVTNPAPRLWIELRGEPKQYLLIEREPSEAALFGRRFTVIFAILSLALFLGVMATMWIIFYLLRDRALLGLGVMNRIKMGDLRARYPVTKVDEFAQNSLVFNQMADQIETLVTSLRNAESARSGLLRELAHDLRTPIAGLKSVLETLHDNSAKLSTDKISHLMELAEREVDYFGSLVGDLLILGTLDEPAYGSEAEPVALAELVREELSTFAQRFPRLHYELIGVPYEAEVIGAPKLLRRAIRNALENASFYAKTTVTAQLLESTGNEEFGRRAEIRLIIEDDGPGFSPSDLLQFGKKRSTRSVSGHGTKRISVGLGSVIMRSIVERHNGLVNPVNIPSASGDPAGARVEFVFPL